MKSLCKNLFLQFMKVLNFQFMRDSAIYENEVFNSSKKRDFKGVTLRDFLETIKG